MTFHPQDPGPFSLSDLQSVLNYMEDNLLEELTPAVIAAHFFVSASVLSPLFKIVCGMTMMEYVRNRRLTLAAQDLSASDASILELACKYGYETPEAFTKAFSRFHGFPPSFVRRGFPVSKAFFPLRLDVTVQGGWNCTNLTKSSPAGQDPSAHFCYNPLIKDKGGRQMCSQNLCRIDLGKMQFQKEWGILCALAEELLQNRIPFKVDGKTMIFAHGLEFPLEKICLTFKWGEEPVVKDFFQDRRMSESSCQRESITSKRFCGGDSPAEKKCAHEYASEARHAEENFKYFDEVYRGMKIRCMFYGDCPEADTDAFLYRNTDSVEIGNLLIPVQSLEFYYENAEEDTPYYDMVAKYLGKPENYRIRNKQAWEYSAYEFWLQNCGQPSERAKKSLENPLGMLKKYAAYFDTYAGVRIANICGSCGKKAIPLAVLGAEVTVFDISEDNRKYALEVAEAAKVPLHYEVCDILEIDRKKYGGYFDVVFMEGGILHYFHDINEFMEILYALLKDGGKMICSDFHPFSKIADILQFEQPSMSYFATDVFEGEMAHARFYSDAVREKMPKCLYRKYTVSEIINAVINCGFRLERFDEHPAWTDERLPGEFTLVAAKPAP